MTSPSLTGRPLTVLLRSVHGLELPAGAVVALASSADAAVDIPVGDGAYNVVGVTAEPIAAGERGRVQIAGTVRAYVHGTVARGDYLQHAGMAAGLLESTGITADATTPPPAGSCAVALEAGLDFELILVNFTGPTPPAGTGGGGSYTNEEAQDAVGSILTDTPEVDFTYDDATPAITAVLRDNSIAAARLTMATGRLIGRSTAAAGQGEEIAIGAGLSLAGGTLSATGGPTYTDEQAQDAVGLILVNSAEVALAYVDATPSISATLITNSVVVSRLTMATGRLVGRTTAGAGQGEEISVGAGLSLAGGVLSSTVVSGPALANPTALVGLAAVNGVALTAMRSDAAPPLSQAIVPTWTGMHTWTARTARTGTLTPTGVANDYIHHYSDQTIEPTADNSQYHNYLTPLFAPATGRTIPLVTVEHVILRTGSAGGVITSARGITVQAQYGTQKPTGTVTGIAVENIGTTGVGQTQAIGIKPQTGTGAFALVSEGGENRMVGFTVFNNLSSAIAPIQLTGTLISNNGYLGEAAYTAGGTQTRAVWVTSSFIPTTNLSFAIGISASPTFNPPSGVNIGEARSLHATLFTGSSAGTITAGFGLLINVVYGTIKPPTVYGAQIVNFGAAGITTAYGLQIAAQAGAVSNIAISSLGGENRLVGPTVVGSDIAPTAGIGFETVSIRSRIRGSLTLSANQMALALDPTINNTGLVTGALEVTPTFNGVGSLPIGLVVRPTMAPSASIGEVRGGSLAAFINPPAGVTIGLATGFYAVLATSAGTGVVSNAQAIYADGALINIGGPAPTAMASLRVGIASGGANNYDVRFDSVDVAASVGALIGRVRVYHAGGGAGYLRVFAS